MRTLNLEDEVEGSMLKVLVLDYDDCPEDIQDRIDKVAEQIRGQYHLDRPQSGFMRIRPHM